MTDSDKGGRTKRPATRQKGKDVKKNRPMDSASGQEASVAIFAEIGLCDDIHR